MDSRLVVLNYYCQQSRLTFKLSTFSLSQSVYLLWCPVGVSEVLNTLLMMKMDRRLFGPLTALHLPMFCRPACVLSCNAFVRVNFLLRPLHHLARVFRLVLLGRGLSHSAAVSTCWCTNSSFHVPSSSYSANYHATSIT